MFGLFKKKSASHAAPEPTLVVLCNLHEKLSNDLTNMYDQYPDANPAEIRFFSMSAISVFIQAYTKLSPSGTQALVDSFVEQCIGNMLFYMPRADYSLVHNAFVGRFGAYPDLIVRGLNANTSQEMQNAYGALIAAMDSYIGVDRGPFDRSVTGVTIVSPLLASLAAGVRNALAA